MRTWTVFALVALVGFSVMSSLITHNIKGGLPTHFVLLIVGVGFVVAYGLQTVLHPPARSSLTVGTSVALVAATLCSVIANLAMYSAASKAPHPALAIAIGSSQAVGVALIGFFFFSETLSAVQLVGLAASVLGIVLVTLGGS